MEQNQKFLGSQLGDQFETQLIEGLIPFNVCPILHAPAIAYPFGLNLAIVPVHEGKPHIRHELAGVMIKSKEGPKKEKPHPLSKSQNQLEWRDPALTFLYLLVIY